jgi:hypothetical protein
MAKDFRRDRREVRVLPWTLREPHALEESEPPGNQATERRILAFAGGARERKELGREEVLAALVEQRALGGTQSLVPGISF